MKVVLDGATEEAPAEYIEVDATRLDIGDRVILGPAPEALFDTVLALLRSLRVQTFIHVEATLEVVEEHGAVRCTGHHTYFTNCRNDVPLNFVFEVVDGQLTIRGV